MAKVTRIICDCCGADIESAFAFFEVSFAVNSPKRTYESCKGCWGKIDLLLSQFKYKDNSDKFPVVEFTTPVVAPEVIEQILPPKPKKKPGRPKKKDLEPVNTTQERSKPTDKLLDSEMVRVKSNFNARKAEKANAKMRGTCEHLFKSFEEGQTICADAPSGAKGPFASFKGCGKRLKESEL